MSRFSEFPKHKVKILQTLLSDEKLVKAVGSNSMNFESVIIENPYDLLYKNIFPFMKIPNVSDEQRTYITMRFSNFKLVNGYFKDGDIIIYIFTHQDLMRTNYGVLRTDYILNRVDELFNKSNDFGIGRLNFRAFNEIDINDTYGGVWVSYNVVDFN